MFPDVYSDQAGSSVGLDWVGKLTKRMATNLGNKVVDPNTAVAPP